MTRLNEAREEQVLIAESIGESLSPAEEALLDHIHERAEREREHEMNGDDLPLDELW